VYAGLEGRRSSEALVSAAGAFRCAGYTAGVAKRTGGGGLLVTYTPARPTPVAKAMR
jgi:hypothetical protein